MKKILFNDFVVETKKRKTSYLKAISKVLDSGWFILGKEVESFEKEFAAYLGVEHVVGVANGLEALQISLMALKIGVGDEVITTPLSAVASSLAILAVGAKPIFVDVNDQGQIDTSLIEAKITSKTKAILPVDLYGLSPNYKQLKQIANKHSLVIVEDACQAHGAYYNKHKLGTCGDVACFSFYPTKNLGAFGDGGAVVTKSKRLAESISQIRNYGQKDRYIHNQYGLNSRLDEMQASILRVKLKNLDKDNERRRQIAKEYLKVFKDNQKVVPLSSSLDHSNFHLFVVKVEKKEQLMKYLSSKNIPSLIHYPVLIPDQPFLKKDYKDEKLPQARKFVSQIVSLPCHPWMTPEQIGYVAQQVIKFYE